MKKELKIFISLILFVVFIVSIVIKGSFSPYKVSNSYTTKKISEKLHVALFLYYVDNKRFPSEKEGLLFGLVKTGKNKPYYHPYYDKAFELGLVLREDCKILVKDERSILARDRYFSLSKKEYLYKLLKKTKGFSLYQDADPISTYYAEEGKSDLFFLGENQSLNKKLLFKNLEKLKYKEDPNCQVGADYIHKLRLSEIKFYLDGEKME